MEVTEAMRGMVSTPAKWATLKPGLLKAMNHPDGQGYALSHTHHAHCTQLQQQPSWLRRLGHGHHEGLHLLNKVHSDAARTGHA